MDKPRYPVNTGIVPVATTRASREFEPWLFYPLSPDELPPRWRRLLVYWSPWPEANSTLAEGEHPVMGASANVTVDRYMIAAQQVMTGMTRPYLSTPLILLKSPL